MLLGSLLLHGLFLMLPVASTPPPGEEEVAEEEVVEPEAAIALSALRETPKPVPQATPKAVPTPSPRITPIQRAQPNPTPVPNIAPSPSPSPEETVEPSPSPEASASPEPEAISEEGSGDITSEVTPEETVPEDLANMRSNLMASLGSADGLIGEPPPFRYFRQPELYFNQPDSGDPNFTKDSAVWLPGIVGIDWYNDTRPDAAIAQFESQFSASGAAMEEIEAGYGGRRLFAITQDGNPVLYLNVIPAPGNISTVVVQWDRDPNTPPPQ